MRQQHKLRSIYPFHNWINSLFFGENKQPEQFEAGKAAESNFLHESSTIIVIIVVIP